MTRQNYNVTLQGLVSVYSACGEAGHELVPTVSRISARAYETVSGTSRHKPQQGFINPTAYSLEAVRADYQQGTCEYYAGVGSKHIYGSYYKGIVGAENGGGRFSGAGHFDACLSPLTVRDDVGLSNKALIAARNKLKSTDINLGVAFGERKQTASLLGSTATRLAGSVRALRRGEIRNAMNQLGISSKRRQPRGQNVPDRWLELQYGWKPLLSDVYGATKALTERKDKGDWRVTVKVTKSQNDTYVRNIIPNGALTNGFDAGQCKARLMRSVFVRLDALPQNEALISLASLGVTNPLSVAWELVPWSFVVDWALPIGSYLESLDALLGYSSATFSSSFYSKASWSDRGKSYSSGNKYIRNNYSGRKRMVYLVRSVSNSVPLPTLPRFKDPRSLGHMANGLALMATAFGRR